MKYYVTFIIAILLQSVLSLPKADVPKITPKKVFNQKYSKTVEKLPKPGGIVKIEQPKPWSREDIYVDSSEEFQIPEKSTQMPDPNSLRGVNWLCIAGVVEDLFKESAEILTCVVAAASNLLKCIQITEMEPHSQEHSYYKEEMTSSL